MFDGSDTPLDTSAEMFNPTFVALEMKYIATRISRSQTFQEKQNAAAPQRGQSPNKFSQLNFPVISGSRKNQNQRARICLARFFFRASIRCSQEQNKR
jgi:hypothetical protein